MSFKAGTYRIEELISAGLMEIGDGYRAKNSELSDQGIPFARAGNINDGFKFASADLFPVNSLSKVGSKLSRPGDVVFTSKGTVGRFALVRDQTQQFVYSPQLCFWRSLAPNRLLPEYLYYWMNSAEFFNQVAYLKGQTDMADYVSLRDQRRITATIPDTTTQRFIVDVVKPLDDRITLLRETNATMEAIAQALFKSWFVDFDPVHARQQGRAPDGMDEATAAFFPDSFEESELGLVPRGWRVGALSDLVHQHKGSLNPLSHPDIFFEHYSLPAFDSGQMPVIEAGSEIKSNKTSVPPRAVLLSKLNPHISRVWMPASAGATAVCSTEFLVFTPAGGASREFVYCSFSAPEFQQLLCQLVTGTSNSHQRVKPDGVLSMRRIVPPPSVLESFEAATRPVFERIGHNRQQAQNLASLRDTLLPRLISGQLRLPEANSVS
ncbi:restriction endonuclease subunit S [Dechloromonas denitrificans]|uniref:restriction endonuclease subunit S n=1 Tax=Dechloromonas denitrificans TaxID=281362 RepID=UPI001CF85D10|nr:restriction endonuclease subunit S [Dechloromonas denitrificans]UCV12300.1 restriction endonuclease subunit S [Dechloromonas denitrificans]